MTNSSSRIGSQKTIESRKSTQSSLPITNPSEIDKANAVNVTSTSVKKTTSNSSRAKKPSDNYSAKGISSGSCDSRRATSSNKSILDPFPKNGIALGMIETRGMVPAIEASDAMTKAAEVILVAREFVGGGYVTVMVRGETGAVNASVRAGADACERVGDGLVAAHIIARPDVEIEPVLKSTPRVHRG